MNHRAWSTLSVKAVDKAQRIVEGIASTPTPDRQGDVMVPAGAKFVLPLPFLWFHNQKDPIGEVFEATVKPDGIHVKARVSKVEAPGRLKTLVDDAWAAFTASPPLVRGLSIGWGEVESEPIKGTNYTRFTKWIWGELSAVTVPMNAEATITAVKAADMAASGLTPPAVAGSPNTSAVKGAQAMTTQEQITQFSNERQTKAGRMVSIMNAAAETGSTLDDQQTQEYDTLKGEVKSLDLHIARLRDQESLNLTAATAITPVTTPAAASELRGGHVPIVQVKSMLPKGIAFARYAICIADAKGDSFRALQRAKSYSDSPEVELMVKAAVAAGDTTTAGAYAELAVQQPQNDFLELLRPKTLLGRIPNLRRVPFNVSVPAQTAGGTYGWVGQGKPKPLTKMTTATVTLAINKIAGIIVLTEELVRISNPDAEALVRDEMIAGITKYMDEQFIDPSVAASGTVRPASITNGTSAVTSAGTSADNALTDVKAVMSAFLTANLSTENAVWIMSESNAFALATAINALGQPLFPGMASGNMTLLGRPVIATQSAGTTVALVDAQGILVADTGGVEVQVSREASLQMDDAPDDPVTASTVLVSMFQQNLVALRAERFVTWKRARTASVKYVAQTYV